MELTLIGLAIMLLSIALYVLIKVYYKRKLDEIDGFEGIIEDNSEF